MNIALNQQNKGIVWDFWQALDDAPNAQIMDLFLNVYCCCLQSAWLVMKITQPPATDIAAATPQRSV